MCIIWRPITLAAFLTGVLAMGALAAPTGKVITYPAPAGEKPSGDWTVTADGRPVFVYTVATLHGGPASFASFDFSGVVKVTITSTRKVASALVCPASFDITPTVKGDEISFELSRPRNVTVEINGTYERALHLFANPLETDAPRPDDPNVLYFGPGVHDIGPQQFAAAKSIYIAGGAIVRPLIQPDEKPTNERDWSGMRNYRHLFVWEGAKGVKVRGHGILDMSQLPWHARTAFVFSGCEDVLVEGLTIIDAPGWVVAFFGCRNVTVRNVKQICQRENSDGVDICNTQDVLVEDCFLRNNDDEVCVKTTSPAPAQESRNILVRRCVIWNERARGLGITSETRRDIANVTFRDCDIIHDFSNGGDCASLAVLVSDAGTMSNIRFEDIRSEDVRSVLINGWIGADFWGRDKERGRVSGVVFRNISGWGAGFPVSRLQGCDGTHLFENVVFQNLRVNGNLVRSLEEGGIALNPFVRNVTIKNDTAPPTAAPNIAGAKALVGDPGVALTWSAVVDPECATHRYHVYRDGKKVAEARKTSYTDAGLAELTDHAYQVSAVNMADLEGPKSQVTRARTLADTASPTVLSVNADDRTHLRVAFSEPVDKGSAQKPEGYKLEGGADVLAASLEADGRTVVLTTSPMPADRTYTLMLSGNKDRSRRGNAVTPGTTTTFAYRLGLVGYWKLNEGARTTAADLSPSGNTARLVNVDPAKCWVEGRQGKALQFDGDKSYVEIPNSASLQAVQEGDYTLAAWVKPEGTLKSSDAAYDSPCGIITKRGYHEGLTYGPRGHFALTHFLAGERAAEIATWEACPPGRFYHVVAVVDRTHGRVRIYLNGKPSGESTFEPGAAARAYGEEPWRIGIGNPDAHADHRWPMKGIISDVVIHSRALGDDEIRRLTEAR